MDGRRQGAGRDGRPHRGPVAQRLPLLPDRHPTADFFICDVLDAIPKDDMASMEHPIFSLSTRPDRRILSYEHNGHQGRDHALRKRAGDDPRQGRHDLLHQPADRQDERRRGAKPGPAPEGARPARRHQPRDQRRRLSPLARNFRAALGHAHHHQHRDRRHRDDDGLRPDRVLGDPAKNPRRADDQRLGEALGLDVPRR